MYMKNLLLITLLCPSIIFAQLKSGRYIMKMIASGKSVQSGATGTVKVTTITGCANPATNCQNEIWEIKTVRGSTGVFTILKVQNRKCLTFKEQVNEPGKILEDVFMEAQKPQAQIRNQSFIIAQDKDGVYTIQPQRIAGFAGRNDVFLAARLSTLNAEGGDVIFETKNPETNPEGARNGSNVFWQFIPVTTGSSSVVVTPVLQSPPVIVTPPSANKLEVDFKTGADNLEPKDFQNNLEIRVIVSGHADIIKTNANNGQAWPNNAIRRVSVPLPADVTVDMLKEIQLYRTAIGSQDNFKASVADNWNLQGLTVNATIKTDGANKRYTLLNRVNILRDGPIFRFVYEMPKNVNEGTIFKTALVYNAPLPATGTNTGTPSTTFAAIFGTGGDNLEGGNGNNVDLVINLKGTPARSILIRNLNNRENWPNFSERRVNKVVPNARFTFADIASIELRHTGGGGIAADNWHLDRFKLTMGINGENRVLVDRVEAPIHMFTGDTRRKVFLVAQ